MFLSPSHPPGRNVSQHKTRVPRIYTLTSYHSYTRIEVYFSKKLRSSLPGPSGDVDTILHYEQIVGHQLLGQRGSIRQHYLSVL